MRRCRVFSVDTRYFAEHSPLYAFLRLVAVAGLQQALRPVDGFTLRTAGASALSVIETQRSIDTEKVSHRSKCKAARIRLRKVGLSQDNLYGRRIL